MAFTASTGDHKVTRSDIFLVDPQGTRRGLEEEPLQERGGAAHR